MASDPTVVSSVVAPTAPVTTPASPPPPPAVAPQPKSGVSLAGFRLNGRFDMNLERRGVSAQPFASGQTQLQNYHHFLFLSRDDVDEPINFTVELTALTFWEASMRVSPSHAPYDLRLKVGKLIVPFGAEPSIKATVVYRGSIRRFCLCFGHKMALPPSSRQA